MDERESPKEALEQARAKAFRLAKHFEAVFGQAKGRTPSQRAVIEHMGICAGDDQNSYRFNDARDGISIVAAGIHRDGAKSILRIVDRQLAIASQSKTSERTKPKTVR